MFTFASRVGALVGVGDNWQEGMKKDRPNRRKDRFPTTVAGWINDGDTVHKNIVFTQTDAELNYDEKINTAWKGDFACGPQVVHFPGAGL